MRAIDRARRRGHVPGQERGRRPVPDGRPSESARSCALKLWRRFVQPRTGSREPSSFGSAARLDGTSLAHGANAKQIGVNLMDRKDIDGKKFIRERMDMAKTQ
ncbi:MAG: cache domain-containing protein, partial [Methylibium sp.]|nr:cache domain-containing protein [Methylibium sp.]